MGTRDRLIFPFLRGEKPEKPSPENILLTERSQSYSEDQQEFLQAEGRWWIMDEADWMVPESFAFWFCSFSKKHLQRFVGDKARPGKLIPIASNMEALTYKPETLTIGWWARVRRSGNKTAQSFVNHNHLPAQETRLFNYCTLAITGGERQCRQLEKKSRRFLPHPFPPITSLCT